MKRIIFIALALIGVAAAQPTGYTFRNTMESTRGFAPLSLMVPSYGDTAFFSWQTSRRAGTMLLDTTGSNKGAYIWYDGYWHPVGSDAGLVGGNLGTGFRVYSPVSKGNYSLFNGYALLIDSASNANGLTFKIDTSLIRTAGNSYNKAQTDANIAAHTFQRALIGGSTLTQNNTIAGGGFTQLWQNNKRLQYESTDSTSLLQNGNIAISLTQDSIKIRKPMRLDGFMVQRKVLSGSFYYRLYNSLNELVVSRSYNEGSHIHFTFMHDTATSSAFHWNQIWPNGNTYLIGGFRRFLGSVADSALWRLGWYNGSGDMPYENPTREGNIYWNNQMQSIRVNVAAGLAGYRSLVWNNTGRAMDSIWINGSNDSLIYTIRDNNRYALKLPSGGGGGSGVTSVGSGYGLSGGPITTTGTLAVDTATLGPVIRGYSRATTSDHNLKITGVDIATNTAWTSLTDGATVTHAPASTTVNAKWTIGGNRTLAITSPQDGKTYLYKVTQDGTGSRTLTLPGGGSASLDPTAGNTTLLAGLYDAAGPTWTWSSSYATSTGVAQSVITDTLQNYWRLGGNTVGSSKKIGSINGQGFDIVSNNNPFITLPSTSTGNLTFGNGTYPNVPSQYDFRYYNASTASRGLKINDVGNGTSVLLSAHTGNRLLVTTGAGAVTNLEYGTWYNTNDGSTLTAGLSGLWYFSSGVKLGWTSSPTAKLHLPVGTATANTAPLKFTQSSAALLTTPEAGAVEALTDKLYYTINTGTARKEVTLNDAALTPGTMPVATTNGRLTDGIIISSGKGTATVSGFANVSSVTGNVIRWTRTDKVVDVTVSFVVTATASATSTSVNIDLPIASTAVVNSSTLGGNGSEVGGNNGKVLGILSNKAQLTYTSSTTSPIEVICHFKYDMP